MYRCLAILSQYDGVTAGCYVSSTGFGVFKGTFLVDKNIAQTFFAGRAPFLYTIYLYVYVVGCIQCNIGF